MTTDVQLDTLEAKGLIRLATVRPELEYLFRHALVQDAAYGSLLKQERRELHGQVGAALEDLYPERRGELSPVLAMHFEHAGQTEKAIGYYLEGARQALRQNALREAYGAFDRAAALTDAAAAEPPVGQRQPAFLQGEAALRRKVEIGVGRAQAGYSFRAPEDAIAQLEAIVPDGEALGDTDLLVRIYMLIALFRLQNGEPADSLEVRRPLERMTDIGAAAGDPSIAAVPKALVGLSRVFAGPVRAGVAALEEALPLLEGHQDSIGAAFARGALAIGLAELGEFDKAEAASRRATEIAAKGDVIAQLDALIADGFVRSLKGELDAAVPIASECFKRAEETGASACMVVSSWILGDVFHRQGRFQEARDVLARGSDVSLVVDRKVWRPTLRAWLGSAAAALGSVPEEDFEESLVTARSIGNRVGEAGILSKQAEVLAGRGDIDGAVPIFQAAVALLEDEGLRPSLARLLRGWAEALQAAGREDEAAPIRQRSIDLFEELGLAREAGITRTAAALGSTRLAFD